MQKLQRGKAFKSAPPLASFTPKLLYLLVALLLPAVFWSSKIQLPLLLRNSPSPASQAEAEKPLSTLEACHSHRYTTEIVSVDPLMIYINNFTSADEAADLIKGGEEYFEQSLVAPKGPNKPHPGRTSQSAPLDPDIPLVDCILNRARSFVGSILQPYEPFSLPQLVKYHPSQRFDLHTDFWLEPRPMDDRSGRKYNRVASFFVFLKANCTGGETHFPFVEVLERDKKKGGRLEEVFQGKVSAHEKGGVAFKPIRGNAIFWINIDEEGRGDARVRHAGLAVEDGEKIGMNIWPRKFY